MCHFFLFEAIIFLRSHFDYIMEKFAIFGMHWAVVEKLVPRSKDKDTLETVLYYAFENRNADECRSLKVIESVMNSVDPTIIRMYTWYAENFF